MCDSVCLCVCNNNTTRGRDCSPLATTINSYKIAIIMNNYKSKYRNRKKIKIKRKIEIKIDIKKKLKK